MVFDSNDIDRGWKDCDQPSCNNRHILQAGMDYECWEKCRKCDSWIVNIVKENKLKGSGGE